MTSLERQQRGLLAIIKHRPVDLEADPWLARVEGSREAALLSAIALWWRRFQIESQCRYTSRLLKRLGCYETEVQRYFETNATSPFIEKMTAAFLHSLSKHPDALVASVASFELACLNRDDSAHRSPIIFDRNPALTLRALDERTNLPFAEPDYYYLLDLDGGVRCTRIPRQT
jgi:hypothetical protein